MRSSKRQIKPATLRIGATMGIPGVLRDLGFDPVEVLNEIGIEIELFDDPDNRISFIARGRMMAHCAERTGCPHFGLLVGQKAGLNAFGVVGLLAKYSSDVHTALDSLIRFMHLHVRGAATELTVESDLAFLSYHIYEKGAPGNNQVGAGAVAVAFNTLRDLCGEDWNPVEIHFAHRKPDDVAPFRKFFGVPLHFNSDQFAVAFNRECLNHRASDSNPELLGLLQQHIDKLELREGDNFADQVRSMLRTTIVTGHASAGQIAELFSIHRRTLNRRLNVHGVSFHDLVDEVSFEIARQLLEDSTLEIIEIALLLRYSNASAFTRAFRRWSSTTPAQWRLEARHK